MHVLTPTQLKIQEGPSADVEICVQLSHFWYYALYMLVLPGLPAVSTLLRVQQTLPSFLCFFLCPWSFLQTMSWIIIKFTMFISQHTGILFLVAGFQMAWSLRSFSGMLVFTAMYILLRAFSMVSYKFRYLYFYCHLPQGIL